MREPEKSGCALTMSKLKIVTLHCLGSNPQKHAHQQWHFVHCAQACAELAAWVYPAGPNLLEPEVVRNLLNNDMIKNSQYLAAPSSQDCT